MLWHKIQGAAGIGGVATSYGTTIFTGTGTTGNTVTITGTAASGADDYVAFLTSDQSLSGFADSNYTQRYYATDFNGSSTAYIGTSEIDNSFTATSVRLTTLAVVPIIGGSYISSGFSQLSKTPPSATVSKGSLAIVALFGQDFPQASSTGTSPPAGYTLLGNALAYNPNFAQDSSSFLWVAAKSISTSGTESPGAWTSNLSGTEIHGSATVILG